MPRSSVVELRRPRGPWCGEGIVNIPHKHGGQKCSECRKEMIWIQGDGWAMFVHDDNSFCGEEEE